MYNFSKNCFIYVLKILINHIADIVIFYNNLFFSFFAGDIK